MEEKNVMIGVISLTELRENTQNGAEQPAGEISRQALKKRVQFYRLESTASGFIGRRRAIPETFMVMITTNFSNSRNAFDRLYNQLILALP